MDIWQPRTVLDKPFAGNKPIPIPSNPHKRPSQRARRSRAPTAATRQTVRTVPEDTRAEQPFDAFLVLDVEATCVLGADFNWVNEIIEWPVCLMRWEDRDETGKGRKLVVVDEFRSYVRPIWRSQLSAFCMELTGIQQSSVENAPTFPDVLTAFRTFLIRNRLIDENGERLERFCFASDGPYDVRDFVPKQCFISKIPIPEYLLGDVLDVRMAARNAFQQAAPKHTRRRPRPVISGSFNISTQLEVLGLGAFEGRPHSGIDDTRNICRILGEVARRDTTLVPNTGIQFTRRWHWMGSNGDILEANVFPANT